MIVDRNGNIRDTASDVEGATECGLTEHGDAAVRKSFLVWVMSKGLARDDAHYSACELELDELLAEES